MAGAILFERAQALTSVNREEGISLLNKIVREQEVAENDEELIRIKEQGILQLGELYKQEGKAKELADLIKVTRPFLSLISKAKAAKLVRSLVDFFLDLEASTGIEVQLCKECIEWAKQEKRTFLRQSLEARLIALYFDTGLYTEALQLGSALLKELKKLDDKMLLVEVQLLESKTYHALSNLPKVRAFCRLHFIPQINRVGLRVWEWDGERVRIATGPKLIRNHRMFWKRIQRNRMATTTAINHNSKYAAK